MGDKKNLSKEILKLQIRTSTQSGVMSSMFILGKMEQNFSEFDKLLNIWSLYCLPEPTFGDPWLYCKTHFFSKVFWNEEEWLTGAVMILPAIGQR